MACNPCENGQHGYCFGSGCSCRCRELPGVILSGIERITHERSRQIGVEGWSPKHDSEHTNGELAMAAACYAAPRPIKAEIRRPCGCRSVGECTHPNGIPALGDPWPWDEKWDKRKKHDRIKQLTIAGALCAAEIDRLQREELIGEQKKHGGSGERPGA